MKDGHHLMRKIATLLVATALGLSVGSAALANRTPAPAPGQTSPTLAPCLTAGKSPAPTNVAKNKECVTTSTSTPPTTTPPTTAPTTTTPIIETTTTTASGFPYTYSFSMTSHGGDSRSGQAVVSYAASSTNLSLVSGASAQTTSIASTPLGVYLYLPSPAFSGSTYTVTLNGTSCAFLGNNANTIDGQGGQWETIQCTFVAENASIVATAIPQT